MNALGPPCTGFIGVKLSLKPVLDWMHVYGPENAYWPAMLSSLMLARSAWICDCSAATSGIGTQRTLRPLGSAAWVAWPAGQPFTGCAEAPCTAVKSAAAAIALSAPRNAFVIEPPVLLVATKRRPLRAL